MCDEHQFHPGGHCCGESGLCNRWPNINWNKVTWKVRQPDALWVEQLYARLAYPGSPVFSHPDFEQPLAYVGAIFNYTGTVGEPAAESTGFLEVFDGFHTYVMNAGEFVAQYAGLCNWTSRTRERCCPLYFALATVQKDFLWWVSPHHFVEQRIKKEKVRAVSAYEGDRVTGPFVVTANNSAVPGGLRLGLSWRDVLRSAACVLLPSLDARGLGLDPYEAIEGGLVRHLNGARALAQNPGPRQSSFYQPTFADILIEPFLSGGIDFGIENDKRSPYYDQFIISSGAQYDREAPGSNESWCSFTPWQLVSGPEVVAEFGHVNRFERTDDNDCLPRWVELELIPR